MAFRGRNELSSPAHATTTRDAGLCHATAHRRSAQVRLDAFDAAIASHFATADPRVDHLRRRIEMAADDVRALLNIQSETEGYLVTFALMLLERAERQFAQAKALKQIL